MVEIRRAILTTPFAVNLSPFIGKVSESPYLLMIVGSTLKGILELPIPFYTQDTPIYGTFVYFCW